MLVIWIIFENLVVLGGSTYTLLSLHGGKHRAWSLHLVQNFIILDSLRNSFVDLFDFFPFFCLDVSSSGLKPVDNLRVVKSECNLCNLNVLLPWSINSSVR